MPGLNWFGTAVAIIALSLSCASGYIYTKEEEECMAIGKLYHSESKNCSDIQSKRNPCPVGQWFVLRKPTEDDEEYIIKGVCVQKRCQDEEFFWSPEGICVASQEVERLCRPTPTEYLGNNDFGEGDCICAKTPPHSRFNGDPTKPCYQLYKKGPCRRGQIFGYPTIESEVPICMSDPCYHEARKQKANGKISHDAILAMKDGKCYELEKQGPCANGSHFQIHQKTMTAECVQHENGGISLVGNCVHEKSGNECLTQVSISDQGRNEKQSQSAIIRKLREQANKRRRSTGAITFL